MFKPLPYLICVCIIVITPVVHAQGSVEPGEEANKELRPILSSIVVNNRNIFETPNKPVSRLINRTHWVTRKEVINREIWLRPGEPITQADLSELERNLRGLHLFSEVSVYTQTSSTDADRVDLIVDTTDKLSLFGAAGGTFLGGIGEVGFLVSETNLWGLGHQLQYRFVKNTESESLGSLSYQNILLAGDDTYADFKFDKSDDGNAITVKVENRFQHVQDPLSWKMELKQETTKQKYFEQGESIAQVPREDKKLVLERTKHTGVHKSSWRFGLHITFEQSTYQAAQGAQANTIDVPDDQDQVFTGFLIAHNRVRNHLKVKGIDTLGFVQDLSLGYNLELLAGMSYRESVAETNTLPVVFFNASSNNLVSSFNYLNAAFNSILGVDQNKLDAWSINGGFTWFNTRFKRQTMAARVKYTTAYNRTGLPPQQLLGEDNGLRGYPAREFSGEQTLVVNLEHRFNSNANFASFEIGTVVFFDTGLVGERRRRIWQEKPLRSTGFGFRFGSPKLLGSAIIRVDFAHPLDELNAKDYKPTFSLAIGQVFGFAP